MGGRVGGRFGVIVWLGVIALELIAVAGWAGSGWATPSYVFMRGPAPMLALIVSVFAQATAGGILVRRRPENRVGWIILAFALLTAIGLAIIARTALDPDGSRSPVVPWLAWFGGSFVYTGASFLAFYLAFVFPVGRIAGGWRRGLAMVAAACGAAAVSMALRPGPLLFFPDIPNPIAPSAAGIDGWLSSLLTALPLLLLAAAGVVSAAALTARYRATEGLVRVQVRWYMAAGVILAVAYAGQLLALLLLGPRDPRGEAIEMADHLSLSLPPIAMTFAILRYRLYDIDTIISRTFVYGALTAVLAGIYAASIRLFNFLFSELTGDKTDLSLVATTLLLATTFTPIKGRLERFAARWLGGAGSASTKGVSTGPNASLAALLEEPEFAAAVDSRVSAVLEARGREQRRRRLGGERASGAEHERRR